MTTLNLNQFSWLSFHFAEIQVTKHTCEEHNSTFYNAQFILFLDNGKEENEDDFLQNKHPIFLETEIYDSCRYCVAAQALDVLKYITPKIYNFVEVYDEEGSNIQTIDLNDVNDREDDEDL